jgi:acyl-CoA dehydrogenase
MSGLEGLGIAFGDEHRELVARVSAVALADLEPLAATEEDRPDEAFDAYARILGDAGLLAETVASAHGGRRERLDLRALCLVREILAGASGLADLVFVMQGLGSYALQQAGADELRRRWLPMVASGEAIAALALTEEHAGSDVAALATTARADGDDFVLDGEKWFISNAGKASFYTVFATADPSAGRKGIAAFFVEADRSGVEVVRRMETLAPHPLGVVRFAGCRVPRGNRIGDEGAGFGLAMATLDMFRATVGAAAVGMAARALREAVAFAKARRQFGKALSEFQLTQAALAEMAVEVDAARLLVYRAACARDRGAERVTYEASTAKLFATEAAQRVVDRALQIHGGRGLLRGSITERLYRDVRALRIYEGTSEIQKLVIASQLLKDDRG